MDWLDAAINFVRNLPPWVWAIIIGAMVSVTVQTLKEAVEIKVKPDKRDSLAATCGLAIVVIAGLLALTGPIGLWIVGGVGFGILLGAMPTAPTTNQQSATTTPTA